jgi:antitoxin component YwqK of YwqJK toxin-antitoxin module
MLLCLFPLPTVAQEQAGDAEATPLGDIKNPVKCDDPSGERYYLARLVNPKGRSIDYSRMGSYIGPNGGILDGYEVKVGDERLEIYMDMYHHGYYEERPVPGFYLRCRVSWDLLIRDNGLRYTADGEEPFDGEFKRKDEETDKTIAKVTVRKGILQGEAIKYHENGKVDERVPYKDGVEHGTARYYDEDEKLKVSFEYKHGKRHGEGTWFRPDGTIEAMYTYKQGKPHGRHFSNHEDGSTKRQGQFKDGRAEGEFITYDKQGNITKREFYREGEVVEDAEKDVEQG